MSSPHVQDSHPQQPQQPHNSNHQLPPPLQHSTPAHAASGEHSLPRSLSTPLHPSQSPHLHSHPPQSQPVQPPSPLPDHSHSHSHSHTQSSHTPHTSHSHSQSHDSDQSKARAAVEESPDGKWARYAVKLGAGTFKDVWLAVDTDTGREVAWNAVDLRKVGSAKEQQRIRQETELLTTLRHPHIIEIYDVWENAARHTLCFITQKSSYTLKQHIANLHPAKIKVIKKYCRQILSALVYLHGLTPPIIHRDIKADNIFIDATTGDIRIGDFGLSISSYNPTSIVGTPGFLSPEMFGESYNELVDIWSFGMCVLEMSTNQYPYIEYNGSVAQLLRKGFEGAKPEALQNVNDPGMREFISMCLQPAEKRPSAKQLLEQKVFDLSETSKSATAATHQHPHPHTQHAADGATTNHTTAAASSTTTATTAPTEQKVSEGAKKNELGTHNSFPTPTKMSVTVTARADSPSSQQPTAPNASSASTALSVVLPQHAQTTPIPTNTPNGPAPPSPQMRAVTDALTPPLISPASSPHSHVVSAGINPTPTSLGTSASSPSLISHGALSPPLAGSTPPASSHSVAASSKQLDPKRELLRVRAESLIPRVSVTKTAELSIVSIVLYVHFPSAKQLRQARKERKERQLVTGATDMSDIGDDDEEEEARNAQQAAAQQQDAADRQSATSTTSSSGSSTPPQRTAGTVKDVTDSYSEQLAASSASALSSSNASLTTSPVTTAQSASQAAGTPPLSLLSSPVSSAELTPIHIQSYDFSRDNYLAVATDITHHYPTFSLLEMDGVEELVAFRIEEATRERYNKWQAKARTTLNSEIMTLLTSLGISLNYALNFIEQEVSQEDLLYLSEEDLAAFIPKLGPRRRLQQYIAEVKASRRLQEVEEEEEAADSEEEREEERRRKKKADKDGKLDKDNKKDKKADKDRERDKDSKQAKKEQQDKSREKGDKGDKDKEEKKERDKEKERGKEKDKTKRKDEDETDTPRIKDRSLSNAALKQQTKDKDKSERADKTEASKRGEKDKVSEEKKGEKKKEKVKESDRQDRPAEKKEKRREEEVGLGSTISSSSNSSGGSSGINSSSGGSMLMDRVDRSLREREKKLTVSRPPSSLGTTSPSVPSSPRSAQSDSGGDEHRRKRSDSEVDFSSAAKLNTSSSSSVSSSNTTPEALKKRRVNSLTGTETVSKGVRSGEKDKQQKERDGLLSAKERRSFIDDPSDSMHALLTKIGTELESKPKKTAGADNSNNNNRGPALTLHTAQLAVGNSGPQSGGHPSSAFSLSTPISTAVGSNGNLPLSRVASTPHTPTAVLHPASGFAAPPSPSTSGILSTPIHLSTATSSASIAPSSSRPSSRPSSPSSSRRGSQPLLTLPAPAIAFAPVTPPTQHTSHNGLSRPVSGSVSAVPGAPSSSSSSSILLPPQHLSRLS